MIRNHQLPAENLSPMDSGEAAGLLSAPVTPDGYYSPGTTTARESRWGFAIKLPLLVGLLVAVVGLWPGIPASVRLTLLIYGLAIIGWAATSLSEGFVGLCAVLAMILTGNLRQERLADVLATDVIWLILGAFVLAEAVKESELGPRICAYLARRARSSRSFAWWLTGWLTVLAFVVPSTTGRAALMLPLVKNLSPGNDSLRRCLNILIPCVILLSTPVSLTGAAAHLMANEMLVANGQPPLSFLWWLILAGPFGVIASVLTAWFVIRRHLPRGCEPFVSTDRPRTRWSRAECVTLGVLTGVVVLGATVGLHSLGFTTILLIATLLLVLPGIGVLDWKDAIKSIPWDTLIFAGSAIWLGKALADSGTSAWVVGKVVAVADPTNTRTVLVALLILCVIAVTAHLYLTSHTLRVAALIPPLLALGTAEGWNSTTVVFLTVIGIDYCLTSPVSSKAILIYEFDRQQASDLMRLSLFLLPAYILLMVLFYFVWWAPLGLSLGGARMS